MMPPSQWLATFGGVGLLRLAPGTWGSAAAVALAWPIHALGGFPALAAATIVVTITGTWATARTIEATGDHDPSQVVVDEVAGQWLALWPLSFGLWHASQDPWLFPWPGWVFGFALFRLFDIWKPGPIGWADRRGTAWGVMLDDLLAGVAAGAVLAAGAAIAHG